ncbi:Putative NAD(P)H nitroreductase YdjA [Shimia thalassica]|uniref:Putative NAD(P)H nitroreductase n=1 Tax=Shimia thalassica TaxID=1715693 RepID=A0A0P1IGR4_9RHOB|nr:nitroreductase family protein [Shimia thalassica]CUJ91123.1 Putative NAD(P)H nitroreductase YdjA [Shimia thalassica]
MPHPNPQALEFLLSRRSRPAKTLTAPVPSRAQLEPLLTAALRTPDHGKLEPWRLVVLDKAALNALGDPVEARGIALGLNAEQIAKGRHQFDTGNLAVVVIEAPVISEKVPEVEQTYSAGAVCLALLNAALASGWGANWLSGWASHDRPFVETSLGLAPHERVAGIIHIGTEKATPPERPRPDLERKVTWVSN